MSLLSLSERDTEFVMAVIVGLYAAYNARYRLFQKEFVMEPFVSLTDSSVFGYELLNRSFIHPKKEWEWSLWNQFLLQNIGIQIDKAESPAYYAVNMNTDQILNPHIIAAITPYLNKYVIIEWTESRYSVLKNLWASSKIHTIEQAALALRDLRTKYHVQIAIDDAGSREGDMDSLARLYLTSPNYVKIDGKLFQKATTHPNLAKLCIRLCEVTRDIGAKSIVEWIETDKDLVFAKKLGADMGQGYLWKSLNKHSKSLG
jgi:c-di-GMP-related signal transduction protein